MRPSDAELYQLALETGQILRRRGMRLVTAESCTGGWVGMVMTAVPGSSAWYDRGFITYSNDAKHAQLGVAMATIEAAGAVSIATVREMAAGALQHSVADIAVSISGIAGPGGGTPQKPVGMVCIGWLMRDGAALETVYHLEGNRDGIRACAVAAALRGVIALLE